MPDRDVMIRTMFDRLSDEELTKRWEAQALGGSGVSHLEHVRVAWALVQRHGARQAEERLVVGTRKGCDHYGVPEKFDEVLTRPWAAEIAAAVTSDETFDDFIRRNPQFELGDLFGRPHD